jgi:undecaprenyl-diphosphatase
VDWPQNLDVALFRFINGTLSNQFLDWLMPLLSQNPFSPPARWFTVAVLAVAIGVLAWRRRHRALACIAIAGIAVGISDGVICNTIKHVVGRPRPFSTLPGVKRPGSLSAEYSWMPAAAPPGDTSGEDSRTTRRYGVVPANATPSTRGNSMPSSHSANCFAVAMVFLVFYRWTLWFTLPIGTLVALSRVYNGVHYPSDVVTGAILGAGTAVAVLWIADRVWRWARPTPGTERASVEHQNVEPGG